MSTVAQSESDQREASEKTATQRRRPYRLSVAQYEAMVASGAFTKADRFELIEGTLVQKMTKNPPHSVVTGLCLDALDRALPPGWHTRLEQPLKIPSRDSRARARRDGGSRQAQDYLDHHPEPVDVALVVEVADSTLQDDRAMAATYGGGGILIYWIVNVAGRTLEVYANPIAGAFPAPTILTETESVELIIHGQPPVGQIAVADLLP